MGLPHPSQTLERGEVYPRSELKRIRKIREVLPRAILKKGRWGKAAETLGSSVPVPVDQ
jgi:hypothetical protein